MKIDGNNLSAYGLTLISKEGFFDMPPRKKPIAYDWGDLIEPLVDVEDIFFEQQIFKAHCIFDPRIGSTAQATITALEALTEIPVEIEGKTGLVGEYLCQIKQINVNSKAGPLERMTITFHHRVPLFNGVIPSSGALGSSHFGGRNFSQFGIKVAGKIDFNSLNQLTRSQQTVFQSGTKYSEFRNLKRVSLDCYLVGNSQADRLAKMEGFKALLASEDLHTLTHGGQTFSTFHSDGFKTKLMGNKVLNFTLNLNVAQ